MGIQGLWQVLEPVAEPVILESLEGKCLAIDISIWLHQAARGYSEHQLNAKCPHLSLVLRRLAKLLFYKIRPLFVFDGPNVPIFKRKLLRDRQVKRYVEELTMTKAQKNVLQQLASSQLHGGERRVEELSEVFSSQIKKRPGDDLFDMSIPSTSRGEMCVMVLQNILDSKTKQSNMQTHLGFKHKLKNMPGERSCGLSQSSDFDQTEFESLTTRDDRVEYLLAVRNNVRRLKLGEVPDDSKAFSNLQIDRLLKRNEINEQLQLLKNEALKLRVLSVDGKPSSSNSRIKLAAMESLDRVHVITDDNGVQIIDEENKTKKNDLMDSLAWPMFLEKIKQENHSNKSKNVFPLEVDNSDYIEAGAFHGNSDDDDNAPKEVINASLFENPVKECSKLQMPVHDCTHQSKGNMIELLRTTFSQRAKDLYHDTWSSSSSESNDEFIELLPELPVHFSEKIGFPSLSPKIDKDSTRSKLERCPIEDISEKNSSTRNSFGESVIQDSYMSINPVLETDFFVFTQEEGVYKDCQDLLRICGIPFVIAPGEAEAQCCELERLGLVQGIISDDSDVWLFGASVIYKNMFNQKRRLQMYRMETIQNQLGKFVRGLHLIRDGAKIILIDNLLSGLSRWETVQLALLSGGDYTNGLEGVGVVAALELISEFATASRTVDSEPSQKAFENLCRISAWLNRRGAWDDSILGSDYNNGLDEGARKFAESSRRLKLRRLIEKHNGPEILEAIPSHEVFKAYAEPLVDSSAEKPKWKSINMEELESFVWEKLGWDKKHLDKQTNHSLLKWNDYLNPAAGGSGKSYQMHITSFTHRLQKSDQDQRLFLTTRVKAALQRLVTIKSSQDHPLSESAKDSSAAEMGKVETNEKMKRKRPNKCIVEKSIKSKQRSTVFPMNKRRKSNEPGIAKNIACNELQLSEESSNDDVY